MDKKTTLLDVVTYLGWRVSITLLVLGALGVNSPIFKEISNLGWFGGLIIKDATTGEAGQQLGFEEREPAQRAALIDEQIKRIVEEGLAR